jgi:hypothetical protein
MIDKSYKVGDTVRYETFTGELRTVRVTGKHDEIKNGRPGFDGVDGNGKGVNVWGYNSQILRVFCQEKRRWK